MGPTHVTARPPPAVAEFLKRVPSRSLGTPSKMFWVPSKNPRVRGAPPAGRGPHTLRHVAFVQVAYSFRPSPDGVQELLRLFSAFQRRAKRNVPRHACGVVVGPQGSTARAIERETNGIVMVSETTDLGKDMRQVRGGGDATLL